MPGKRTNRIVLTNEGRVLRQLRIAQGLSMKKVGTLIGVSDSYIAHLETGRMDVPDGERLERLLKVYGGIKLKAFKERVRNFTIKRTSKDELMDLIQRANAAQMKTTILLLKGLLAV